MSIETTKRTRPSPAWELATPDPLACRQLGAALSLPPLVVQCLLNRGQHDPAVITHFLQPKLARLSDPFLLPDLEKAATRLLAARGRNESILIFGDYDVDGISSVALLTEFLAHFEIRSTCYLPHRMEEGYGLSEEAVAAALSGTKPHVFIAVDCGSSSASIIENLQASGIDVIVLDHHQLSAPEPKPHALVNPQREEGVASAQRELCSAGLAFKLAHGTVKLARQHGLPCADTCDVRRWLDFVALGIVADLAPVLGENRILLAAGLRSLNNTPRPGLSALREAAGIKHEVGVFEIGFQLAPRLNAAGRLESAQEALSLLLTPDPSAAQRLALVLDGQNRERQQIEKKILDEVLDRVRRSFDGERDWIIVEGSDTWHIGVVGIVAARVLREFHRPVIVLGGEAPWRGSGRSIPGFDLASALRECDGLLLRHGGHAMAAGVTMDPTQLEAFRARLNEIAHATIAPHQLQPKIRLDAAVSLAEISPSLVENLRRIGPFGQGLPPIQLCAHGLRLRQPPRRMGSAQQHARLEVADESAAVEAVVWNTAASELPTVDEKFDLAFVPEMNTFRGRANVQLRLLDWRRAS